MTKLGRVDRRVLRRYQEFRDHPPGMATWLYMMLPYQLVIAALFIPMATAAYVLLHPALAAFIAGAYLGAVCRDFAFFRRVLQTWPTTREVIDWDRVEALLAADEGRG